MLNAFIKDNIVYGGSVSLDDNTCTCNSLALACWQIYSFEVTYIFLLNHSFSLETDVF